MARSLVAAGHEVHYTCREQMREAIEDTGATFHSDIELMPELYEGREPDIWGAFESIKREHGLEGDNMAEAFFKVKPYGQDLMLPGIIRWLRSLRPCAVAYCPMMTEEAAYAARFLGIPSVALLTTAGAGSIPASWKEFFSMCNSSEKAIFQVTETSDLLRSATDRLNEKYGLALKYTQNLEPFGKLDVLKFSFTTLVTTCEHLQDPVTSDLQEAYAKDGVTFEAVGPLLDQEGAKRAAGHKFAGDHDNGKPASQDSHRDIDAAEVLQQVAAARDAGRSVVLVSMGTVITGDSPDLGWDGRTIGADGKRHGLTGRELCQAAWGGAFDALGASSPEEGPLLVVSLGPQPEALGGLVPPANALCVPTVPQVDILRAGVDVFLTHGGQNSFNEALSNAAPLVVCPGFGDQAVNARKAEALGVGAQVLRPQPEEGSEAAAAAQYRSEVSVALRRVLSEDTFRGAAAGCAEQLRQAGGVPRAVEVMLAAAAAGTAQQAMPSHSDKQTFSMLPTAVMPRRAGGA